MKAKSRKTSKLQHALITGGTGFIGTNLADRLLTAGRPVVLYDNLSRPGTEKNLKWLVEKHGNRVQMETADIRDRTALSNALKAAGQVFHLAAQVAVTKSLADPVHDFEVNCLGTLSLLEEIRKLKVRPPLLFASTNKVYGELEDLRLHADGTRYEPLNPCTGMFGIGEDRSLDFRSPYGCSKGSADQYVIDYTRAFGIDAVVFRMSCIYGPHQFGTEDQGWVAHFIKKAIEGETITLYGDGMQVRDILYIDDLIEAFLLAQAKIKNISGQAFNIGGGPENTLSLIELLDLIEDLHGKRPQVRFAEWRACDQKYYVSKARKFQLAAAWRPRIGVPEGVKRLYDWLATNA